MPIAWNVESGMVGQKTSSSIFLKFTTSFTKPSTSTTGTSGHPLHLRVEPWSSLGQQEQGETLLLQQDPEGKKMPSGTSSPGYRGASSSTSSSSPTSGSIRNTSARKKIVMRRPSEIRNSNFSNEKSQKTYLSGSRLETGLETSLTRPALLRRSGTTSGESLQSLVRGKGARSFISPVSGQTTGTVCATATIDCRTAQVLSRGNVKTTATDSSGTTDQWEEQEPNYGIGIHSASENWNRIGQQPSAANPGTNNSRQNQPHHHSS